MTVVFASNYYNHHQSGFCAQMDELTGHHFWFIETMQMEAERRSMGWEIADYPDYVIRSYAPGEMARCRKLMMEADVVIWGACPFRMVLPRLMARKLTFQYAERIFKSGKSGLMFWGRVVKYVLMLGAFQKNHYTLCSSAYTAADHALIGQFRGRVFQWGYFPECLEYEPEQLMDGKIPNSILWVARLIPLKHPEMVLEAARRLKAEGYQFQLEMVGGGPMEAELQAQVQQDHLEDCVVLSGMATPEQVRQKMERASIFLFTSDQHEGWGAVVNESMNGGCADIVCRAVGAGPFLIQEGKNGFLYPLGDQEALYRKLKALLDDPAMTRQIGMQAYQTIHQEWNIRSASQRLIQLFDDLLKSGTPMHLPESGPCSIAPVLED